MWGAAQCRGKLSPLLQELAAMGGAWLNNAGAPSPFTLSGGLCQGGEEGAAIGAELPGLAGGC